MPYAWALLLYLAAAEAQFSGLPGLEGGPPASVPLLAVSGFSFSMPHGSSSYKPSSYASYDPYGPTDWSEAGSSMLVPDAPDDDDGGMDDGRTPLNFPKNAKKIPGFTPDLPGIMFDYTAPVLKNMISAGSNNDGGPSSNHGSNFGSSHGGSIQGYRLPTMNFGVSDSRERDYPPQGSDNFNNHNNFNSYGSFSSYGNPRQQHRFGSFSSGFQGDYQSQPSQPRPSFGDLSYRQYQSPPQQQHQQQQAQSYGGFGDIGSGRMRGGDYGRPFGGRSFPGGRASEAFFSRPGNGGRMRGFGYTGGMGNRRSDSPNPALNSASLQRRLGLPAAAAAADPASTPTAARIAASDPAPNAARVAASAGPPPPPQPQAQALSGALRAPLYRHAYHVDVVGDGFGYRYAVENSRGGSPLAFAPGPPDYLHISSMTHA